MRRLLLFLVAAALVAAPAAAADTVLKTAFNKKLKTAVLVDARGMTLYYWLQDIGQTSVCVDDPTYHCSKLWPPLLTADTATAGSGARQALLGTVERADHTLQVTYAGHPVYTFKGGGALATPGDRRPGDVRGQGVINEWWVLSPAGKPIKKRPK
jgi:predicted lipoprotein with Yx(FWY)xxD motif